jgi:predicted RNA binding protein YcfA (HicA-like mRNA interferase family)
MSRLPICTAAELEKILLRLGFKIERQKGSHRFYRHNDGRYTTIPHHANADMNWPLINLILKQVQLDASTYQKLLNEV